MTVSVAITEPFKVAVMVTVVCAVTELVVTVNAPVVLPAGIGILDKMNVATDGLLLESSTTVGPSGAWLRVTVPLTDAPPSIIVGGPKTMDSTCAAVTGSTVSVAMAVPFSVAVNVTVVCVTTVEVVIVNVAETAPAGMVRLEVEIVATAVFGFVSATVEPPEGAADEIVTVPVEVPLTPPSTSEGISVRDTTLGGGGGTFAVTALPVTPEHASGRDARIKISRTRHAEHAALRLVGVTERRFVL